MENKIISIEDIENGFAIKAINNGKEVEAKLVDNGQGYQMLYDGKTFDLTTGRTIRRNGCGKTYTDEAIYIMYQPENAISQFVDWWQGSFLLEDGDEYTIKAIFWSVVQWVNEKFGV